MLKKFSLIGVFVFVVIFSFFSLTQKTEAQFGGCNQLTYGIQVQQVDCNPTASCVVTSRCAFTTGVPGGIYRCEMDRTTTYKTVTTTCNSSNQVVSSETACGAPVTSFCNAYITQTGCYTNADCPHPPGTSCDTSCNLSAGTPGSCTQIDPLCSIYGGGGFYCGDGYCSAGEDNSNCSSDCPAVSPPPDFVITVDPSQKNIIKGGSTSYIVTVNPTNGFVTKVALGAICPPNATCDITANANPTSGEPGTVDLSYGSQTATLFVNNTASISIGNFSIDVVGIGNSKTHYVYPLLKVVPGIPAFLNTSVSSGCPARSITLQWGAGQGANSYRIYRNTSNAMPVSTYKVVGNVTSDTDFPAAGLTYYYWIESSHSPSGNYSAAVASAPVNLDVCPPIIPTAPVVEMTGWGGAVTQASANNGPITMAIGGTGGLVWITSNATSCQIFRDGTLVGNYPVNGSAGVGPMTVTNTHSIVCTGPGGTSNTDSVIHQVPPTVSLSASPTTGASPLSTTLSWSTGNSPTSCTAGGGWSGSKTPNGGSQVISGIVTGTSYTLYCTNAAGNSTTASVTVTPIGAISVSISANPASMTLPTNATRLTWTTTGNPTSCTASNYWSGAKTASGGFEDRTGMTAGTSVFVITCSKNGVPDTSASVTVTVASATLVNNASCTSITAPGSVVAGSTFSGTIVMQNIGTKTWDNIYTSPSDQEHKLTSWNPSANTRWGISHLLLPGGTAVPPGSSATFTANFTAPLTTGTYSFDFSMLEENVEWFGTPCAKNGGVIVTAPTTTGTVSPASPTCTIASGASSCTVNLTWSTANPVGTSAITAVGMANVNGNSGTNVAFSVPYNARIFYLYNNAILLATSNATASCAGGTIFIGGICAASGVPQASFSLNSTSMSFTGTSGGATPNAQTLQIVSNGTIDVWYTATSNQGWCQINGAASVLGAVGSSPPGQFSPVNITVASPGTMSVGPNTCLITVNDPNASPTSQVLTVTYNVAAGAVTQYNLTINKTIGGSVNSGNLVGTVFTPDGLVSCGATCIHAYDQGSIVTLQAVPDTVQWRFVGWGGGSCSGTGYCSLTIDGNKTVTAQFRPRALLYQEF